MKMIKAIGVTINKSHCLFEWAGPVPLHALEVIA
jgi:hypothetical protein